MSRDAVARRVYAWEDRVVAPRDRSVVRFEHMQALVDHVWAAEGLRWPPRMRHRKATRATLATGSRLAIEAPDELPSWVLLHEIAHALCDPDDGRAGDHGADFVGLYVHLLVRHARLDRDMLAQSLAEAGIAWNPDARPALLRD
ncbi:SprT-like domain-containing protein [Falsiroseomonas tokyonensis]|uniref:SprT-like domain-containing protein n=1 Tax=Falsiroseomonas tokyonensis TaxID=430521 RepID=A0ABV7BUK0_9PROT|nr:SprT-like domain-containing protein [Falsiroseomonas tokyonensis]MBU8539180.1 hypothetical protein [Falsiroseomonas tokyonensis]